MNCCDYDCNQGRNCPARVARVSRRLPGPEPLPPVNGKRYLAPLARAMLLAVALSAVMSLALMLV